MKIAILTTDNREHFKEYDSQKPYFGTAPEALLQGFANMPDVEVHVISCAQRPLISAEKIGPNIFYHGLYVPKIGWARTFYQGCIRAVRKKLQSIRPDIVHGQGTERDCALNAVFSGWPNVLTIHGNMRLIARVNKARPFTFFWLASRLEALTIPRSAGVVCITNYTRDAIAGLAKKTWVVPNAVDASFFAVESQRVQTQAPIVLCVGLVCPRKNQNAFVRMLDPLAEKLEFKVVFLGHTVRGRAYDEEFFQLIGSRPWCAYEGFADREKLKGWLSQSSALVLPSIEDNCPMVVLESMAAGVPVLAANVGGLPDLIEDGTNGLLCNPTDPHSVRNGLSRMLEQPELAHRLAAQAKTLAHAKYHPVTIARRHLEIYREVLNTRS
jgi:glycosyltransferase involved in cell wall biosynthesis